MQVDADGRRPVDHAARAVAVEPDISDYSGLPAAVRGSGSRDEPCSIGDLALVGEWAVVVAAFIPDATTEVMTENPFNAAPTEGVYAMASITVTYQGSSEGSAYSDLRFVLRGGDAVQYADSESVAVLPSALCDAHTLEEGGRATGNVSFDCPVTALPGATIFVERILDFEGTSRRYWRVS